MRAIVILVASLALLSCSDQGSEVAKVAEVSPSRELAERLAQADTVVFESWNGKLKGADSDSLLHFHRDSAVVLEERSIGIRSFEGTYEVDSDGTIKVDIPGYNGSWPTMKLDLDGGDLVLHRQDGHTSWLPPDYPDPPSSVDAFWPFRESK